ncbi:unannotated protein [freshwater metagenome]|uniref:Unannotated protein n=1 Tax=freshwater metagenome TaxID=449393 RepID=A0A6J7F277_9ZZZZ
MNFPIRATAAAKSIAPKIIIRGAGAKDSTNIDKSSIRLSPSGPSFKVFVVPCIKSARAPSIAAKSRCSFPREPCASFFVRTILAPTVELPAINVATPTAFLSSIDLVT